MSARVIIAHIYGILCFTQQNFQLHAIIYRSSVCVFNLGEFNERVQNGFDVINLNLH